MNDPVADLLARLRNAALVKKEFCVMPASSFRKAVLDVLVREGYVSRYETYVERKSIDFIKVFLKYHRGRSAIDFSKRVSRLGRRVYKGVKEIPLVRNGLGIFVVSTSKGVLSDREAREKSVGGEVLCSVA